MAKILSQSGDSLADAYDIEGSIAGIDNLLSEEVNLVHEMGATIFSERLSSRILSISAGAISQSSSLDINFSVNEMSRLLGIQVLTSAAARLSIVQVSITSPPAVDNSDMPIFVWDGGGDSFRTARLLINGSFQTLELLLPGNVPLLPNLLIGPNSPRPAATISLQLEPVLVV